MWNRAGGWPIAYYRLRGIDYFQAYVIQSNRKIARPTIKEKDIQHHSPAKFTWKGGDYLIPTKDAERFANPFNAPAALYEFDDSRPVPVFDRTAPKCDPLLIHAGFNNDLTVKFGRLGVKMKKADQAFLVILVMVAVMAAVLAAYYSYNAACAVHSPVCVGAR